MKVMTISMESMRVAVDKVAPRPLFCSPPSVHRPSTTTIRRNLNRIGLDKKWVSVCVLVVRAPPSDGYFDFDLLVGSIDRSIFLNSMK
jgi:hypothetical protein